MPCRLLEAQGSASDLQVTTAFFQFCIRLVAERVTGVFWPTIVRMKTELWQDLGVFSTLRWK